MADFFEERANDVAEGIINKWKEKQQTEEQKKDNFNKVNVYNGLRALVHTLEMQNFRALKNRFAQWKQAFRLTEKDNFQQAIDQEKEK
jgi:hypothetical protein